MRKIVLATALISSSLALAACQSKEADSVEDAGRHEADALEDHADLAKETGDQATADALNAQAGDVKQTGKDAAKAVDNNDMSAQQGMQAVDEAAGVAE
ncbi:MAG: hypothetical protein ACK5NN_13665 [Sphingomonadaceae bacterium]